MRHWSIPTKLTLIMVPLAAVTVVVAIFLAWDLVTGDPVSGFSGDDVLAAAVVAVSALVAGGSLVVSYLVGRSMSRGITDVSAAARTIAHKDLGELLDTLRSPDREVGEIAPVELDTGRGDEIGDLSRAFTELHGSLIDVAGRQMEALRRGVASIFVTLARRNNSLVDRQIALLDDLEAREDDPKTLGGYYQLDHLATRMRRNSESLLVLAGSESPRVWAKATEMADVVRAAIGEVDEYQRIEVLALEPARLSGGAVSDVSHLLAELLENAIQFSPPSEAVRVTGLFNTDGYQITVSDRGVGISEIRAGELNRILARPPALGLSVEPTLGMYVVARLANRHGVAVELIRGVPGVTARVTIPRDLLEMPKQPEPRPWETLRRKRTVPASTLPGELVDIESQEYVLRRTQAREEVAVSDNVIDLTDPSLTGEGVETRQLPVRTPGESFGDSDTEISVGPGQSAISLKSALSAYDAGRRRAAVDGADEEEDPT